MTEQAGWWITDRSQLASGSWIVTVCTRDGRRRTITTDKATANGEGLAVLVDAVIATEPAPPGVEW